MQCRFCGQPMASSRIARLPYYTCRDCYNEQQRMWHHNKRSNRWARGTARTYNLDYNEVHSLIETKKQCEACGSTERLNIDHCHKTNKVRGMLCNSCNMALGQLGDSLERIERLYIYLRIRTT